MIRPLLLLAACAVAILATGPARATFESKQVRYLAPYDLFKTLQTLLPLSVQAKKEMPVHCLELSPSNRAVIGDNQPATGRPALSEPSGGFVRWYAMCLTVYIDHSTSDARRLFKTSEEALTALYGEDAIHYLKTSSPQNLSQLDSPWSSLPADLRTKMLDYQVRRFIGPEAVLLSFGIVHSQQEMTQAIEASLAKEAQPLSVQSALQKSIFFIVLRDEFLSY